MPLGLVALSDVSSMDGEHGMGEASWQPLDSETDALPRPRPWAGLSAARVRVTLMGGTVATRYSGRLELTWTNKELRLLAHENGSYEWVPPSDYRVAEVRLLHDAGTVGETHAGRERAKDNLLIRGDALATITSLTRLPEFSRQLVGKVRLAYLDPPFNTQQAFAHYDDALEHSVWLTMMRDRLALISTLLADDGSIWVHCDDTEQAYLKVVMDELFGRTNFVATIVWQKRYSRENRKAIGFSHDYILVYAKCGPQEWAQRRNRLPRDAKTAKQYRNPNNDPRGPWRVIPMDAQGFRPNQMYEVVSPTGTIFRPPKGRCWGFLEERYRELEAQGRIYFGKNGTSRPGIIRYLSETEGLVPSTWWPNEEAGHTDEAKKEILALFPDQEAFDTPKPERLMHRIIEVATERGDLVFDCFAGSATTAAVAHKLGRRWITAEWSVETVEMFSLPRLEKVVAGTDSGGITATAGWKGGGGFRILDVAASMFDEDEGLVVLADWATGGALAEATAAQLGFAYEEDQPFVGRKGKMRLAVIDALVSKADVELLLSALPEDQRLTICGTTIDDEAAEFLRERRRGSRVRKIPASILAEYQQTHRWRPVPPADASTTKPEGSTAARKPTRSEAKTSTTEQVATGTRRKGAKAVS
jgi:adenine-specific DNA-methyltransferase